jgi:hypothetical protein
MTHRVIATDAAVVGGTAAGVSAALTLSARGIRPTLVGPIKRSHDESAVRAAGDAVHWLPEASIVGSFPDEELVITTAGELAAVRAQSVIVAPDARAWRWPLPGSELPALREFDRLAMLRPGSRVLVVGAASALPEVAQLIEAHPAITIVSTAPGDRLLRVTPHWTEWKCALSSSTIIADAVVVVDAVVEASELTRLAGCEHAPGHQGVGLRCWRDAAMRTSRPRWMVAGEAGFGEQVAVLQGDIAARTACGESIEPQLQDALTQAMSSDPAIEINESMWHSDECDDNTIVCACEGVTCGQLRAAELDGAQGWEIKTRTRAGMGLCQGRYCEESVQRLTKGRSGRFTIRPPIEPLPLRVVPINRKR